MEKIVNYLLEVSFIAVLAKALIFTPGISEALILVSLVISICYKHIYVSRNKLEAQDLIKQDMDEQKKEIEQIKNAVMSMKLAQNFSTPRKSGVAFNETEETKTTPIRRF